MGEQLFQTTPDLLIQTFAEALMSPDADAVCGPEWLLDRRRQAEHALISVVATSYLLAFRRDGWRKLVEFLGITLLSQSQVSELAKDTPGKAVRIRPLRHCCTRPTTSPTGRCVRPVRSHPYRDQHSISEITGGIPGGGADSERPIADDCPALRLRPVSRGARRHGGRHTVGPRGPPCCTSGLVCPST